MQEWKSPTDEILKSIGLRRFRFMRWWFIILIILGIAAVVFVFKSKTPEIIIELNKIGSLTDFLISAAHAQASTPSSDKLSLKILITAGVFVVLSIVYLIAIGKVLFAQDRDNLETATDLVKTLTGFFVGVGTSAFA